LSHSTEAGYQTDGVDPDAGSPATPFAFKVVYADFENQPPAHVDVCIDGTCRGMTLDPAAAGPLQDGDHRNGEQYVYATTLAPGTHSYRFESSDGTDAARLPASGSLTGPVVAAALPGIAINDVGVTEGHAGLTNATFRVTLSQASAQPVTVWYFTWPGTATLFADFLPLVGQLTIPAGHRQGAIAVRVRGELFDEADETFFVFLLAPNGGVIVDGLGQGTIVDDDQ
jgi:hypothetical protein